MSLPDRFDVATHDGLNRADDEDVLADVSGRSSNLWQLECSVLLDVIVEHSNGDLDTKYLDWHRSIKLISTHVRISRCTCFRLETGYSKPRYVSSISFPTFVDDLSVISQAIPKAPAARSEPPSSEPMKKLVSAPHLAI